MSRFASIGAAVFITGAILGSHVFAGDNASALPSAGCEVSSFAPEVHTFYGDKDAILSKSKSKDLDLASRRVYVLLIESVHGTELFYYEQAGSTRVNVLHWTGKPLVELRHVIDDEIIANRGVHCVGEQTKALIIRNELIRSGLSEQNEPVLAPANLNAAVRHVLNGKPAGEYFRVTAYLLC